MIFKQFRYFSALLWLALGAAYAAPGDDAVLAAYDAYRAGDAMKLARSAKGADRHALAPWIEYWRTSLRLEDAQAADVQTFLATYQNTYVAERLRGEWLKLLGRRGDWANFERELPQ